MTSAPTDWGAVLIVVFSNLAGIIGAMTVLLVVIRSLFKGISDKQDGHVSKLIDVASDVSELKGQVNSVLTTVAARRKEPNGS